MGSSVNDFSLLSLTLLFSCYSLLVTFVRTKTNRSYFYFVPSSPQLSTKKTQNKEMAFVCVLIRTRVKILKPWYARFVVDRSVTLQDLFCKFASNKLQLKRELEQLSYTKRTLFSALPS